MKSSEEDVGNEKDKFAAMYGLDEPDLYKIGFTTSGQTRNQILTKLEQVVRNREIKSYSSRLYEEAKTFIWRGNKAQAQKGRNDDLIMSLAIGIWLYDTSPVHSKHAYDLNKAMLDGFDVNSRPMDRDAPTPWEDKSYNPFKPFHVGEMPVSGSNHPMGDLGWLL